VAQDETNPVNNDTVRYRLGIEPNNPLWLLVPILTFAGVWYLTTLEDMTWVWWGIFLAGIVGLYALASVSELRVDTAEA
jgi:hypothetical protein